MMEGIGYPYCLATSEKFTSTIFSMVGGLSLQALMLLRLLYLMELTIPYFSYRETRRAGYGTRIRERQTTARSYKPLGRVRFSFLSPIGIASSVALP